MDTKNQTSRFVGPEDLREGDYVTITDVTCELVPLLCDESWRTRAEAIKVRLTPGCAGWPQKVVTICLPFVLVKDPRGVHGTIDLRRCRIARLTRDYRKEAFKRFRRDAETRRAATV